MIEKVYQKDEIIFTTGDPSDFAYLIEDGKVDVLEGYPEKPIKLATLEPGNILGEMGLVDERPRSLTARAIEETTVKTMTRSQFVDLILNKPEESFRYLGMFFERLRAMNMRVAHGDELPADIDPAEKELRVRIYPLTKPAMESVERDGLEIENFPFRVGRASRRKTDPLNVNDLLLPDRPPFNVSHNHFSIEKNNGVIFIHDRGSYLGTRVNGKVIGGRHKGAWTELEEGDNEVVAGSSHSLFKFRVEVFDK